MYNDEGRANIKKTNEKHSVEIKIKWFSRKFVSQVSFGVT
jgi:hypothetical protein